MQENWYFTIALAAMLPSLHLQAETTSDTGVFAAMQRLKKHDEQVSILTPVQIIGQAEINWRDIKLMGRTGGVTENH